MSRLNYCDPFQDGSPIVLLLHGLGANSVSWALQFDALRTAGLRPVAPDIPGFGDSFYDGRGWNFKRVARDLADLVNELRGENIYVVGLSMGGVIAQQFTLDYPVLVKKLVLVSAFSTLQPLNLSQWFYFAQRALAVHTLGLKTQSRIVARRVFPDPNQVTLREMAEKQIASADPRAYRAAMRSLAFFNSQRRLKELKLPTLVISGSNDTTVAPRYQKVMAEGIFGAQQIIISGAGHAVPIDHAEEFNSVLIKFLLE